MWYQHRAADTYVFQFRLWAYTDQSFNRTGKFLLRLGFSVSCCGPAGSEGWNSSSPSSRSRVSPS